MSGLVWATQLPAGSGNTYRRFVAHRTMTVTFRKRGRGCSWTALRPPRTIVPGPTMAAGGDLPHDLYTFVIESELGLEFGFWGCIAAGATFRTLGRKRTPQGTAVIAQHLHDLDAAEARINEIYFGWRSGTPTPLDHELDTMLARWRALAEDEELVVEWPSRRPTNGRQPTRPS
jgi:hypothetical protein